GNARRLDRRLEQRLDRGEARLRAAAAICVGEWRVKRICGKWPEAGFVWIHFAGERQRHQRAPVKSAGERNDRGPAGRVPRNLDGVLDRLGAGGQKDVFLGAAIGASWFIRSASLTYDSYGVTPKQV